MLIGLLAFCSAVTFFIGATTSQIPYDPWIDHNADGKINYEDLFALADHYSGEGTPINQAAVQFEGNISVPAAAFTPQYTYYDWRNCGTSLHNNDVTLSSQWYAQVQLPHGANITNLTSYWFDNNASHGVDCYLRRYNQEAAWTMAIAVPPDADMPGFGSYKAPFIQYETVDNNKYAYYLCVSLPSPSSDFYFQYAVIEWEY